MGFLRREAGGIFIQNPTLLVETRSGNEKAPMRGASDRVRKGYFFLPVWGFSSCACLADR
jgi:hypothetical protein